MTAFYYLVRMILYKNIKQFFTKVSLACIALISGCDKKTNEEWVPYVPVNIVLNTSDPLFVKLNAPGGWAYINGGSRGLVVIRANQNDFKAFDRHCPYNPKSDCGKINVDISQVLAADSCCGSQFVLLDGSISKGPATRPLREYQTIYDGNRLSISN